MKGVGGNVGSGKSESQEVGGGSYSPSIYWRDARNVGH